MTPADLVLPSFIGDALSLGPHWIYNPGKIRRLYPDGINAYDKPQTEYHAGKGAGDFTHYGDQTLVLLHSLAQARAAVNGELQESANALGLTCHVPEAFPLTLVIALRFEDDHLLGNPADDDYVARLIAAWATRALV